MRAVRLSLVTAVATAAALTSMTACTSKSDASDGDAIQVTAADSTCETSAKTVPAGQVTLKIENKGSKATEVEIVFPDDRIVSEKENIGPGTKYTLTAEIKAGSYEIACRPGMKGHGVRQKLTVTGANAAAKRDPALDQAVAQYRQYAQDQADETVPLAQKFADAIKAGDLEAAKKAYAPSRIGWERTEPVAESFGDIDPKTDTRADGLEQGQKWTGWHRLEKALWQDKKIGAEEKTLADQLVADLKNWQQRVGKAEITPTSMANGAKELLDEVATGKVTGEEDRYSHTDLVDFKANVEGAQKAYELLKPVAEKNDAALTGELDKQFAALNTVLDKYRTDKASYDFVSYDKVGKDQRKELSDAVNALAEPLSKLAAAVAK
ncbi:lipoprotein [Streptomyces sp. e14]|uniref:iron uptake system protein EfeO n=1 Tax=unclassified Streptomyces TaxID=2593676 RepID=UPI0001D06943|nr:MULTISPECIES: iron uptake system protein EfeO [unclassified Streptomyces]EFF90710.1 lipoprotein [Streptomyces sp. e14]NED36855.1 iron uptake system protein EfeO [Streptomyces sp. SID8499]NED75566.1 iron uptake system protein EfeO [Streptomyces sp. SID9944]NMO36200.1 iron uptake system protein EfeO [Streptomyces sp. GMY02]